MCLLFRTGKGYFAMSKRQMSRTVQTGLPGGEYTNIIDGSRVMVGADGSATIEINNPGDKIQCVPFCVDTLYNVHETCIVQS